MERREFITFLGGAARIAARGAGATTARPNDWISPCFAKPEPRGGIPQGFERNGLRRPPEPRNYMETT
jgi:hypothetical protein